MAHPGIFTIIAAVSFALLSPISTSAEIQTFRDCDECPKMVVVPAGAYFMGTPQSVTQREGVPKKRAARELPVHPVRLTAAFGIGQFEVTRRQYAVFVHETKRSGGSCKYWTGDKFATDAAKDWHDPGYPQEDDHPAVCISWDDAKAYVSWLAARTGRPYRLPSEAEWEYAARAGTGTPRFWGSDAEQACRFANVFDRDGSMPGEFPQMAPHECYDGYVRTSPVGSFQPNAFGLHDTAGNAWEWTEDCWHKTYDGAPSDGAAWIKDGRCSQRVLRGGSWISIARFVRSGNRSKIDKDARIYRNGFRVALTLKP